MIKIESHYVDFNTAKLLKEKGFDVLVDGRYYWDISQWKLSQKGALKWNKQEDSYPAPKQHIVVEWLRINHGIWVYCYPVAPYVIDDEDYPKVVWISKICSLNKVNFEKYIDADNGLAINHHHSPKEAYSAAFDYVLNKLI